MTKYFILNFGPPASGKGAIRQIVYDAFQIEKIVDIDVDKYVVSVCKQINNMYGGSENCDELNQADYRKYRDPYGNAKSSDELLNALYNESHVLIETTGNSTDYTKKIFIKLAKNFGYEIILIIPIINLVTLIERCRGRKQAANCDFNYLNGIRKNSYRNFVEIATQSDHVLIFDNNGKSPKLVYQNNKDICDLIEDEDEDTKIINSYIETKCHNRKSKKRTI
jgi:predicted ABC-type ATPase